MNMQELIKKINEIATETPFPDTKIVDHSEVIKLIEQLDEPKPLKLKDIISRMKQLFPLSRNEWIDEILHEFGDDFGLWKYKAGLEQGKLEGEFNSRKPKDADNILQELNKPVVPQFVAEWIDTVKNKQKKDFRFNNEVIHSDDVYRVMFGILREDASTQEVKNWVVDNADTFSLAWILGYTVEKEKRYLVKAKGVYFNSCLIFEKINKKWLFSSAYEIDHQRGHHTRKELEAGGFGWVFDCPGIEIEEVE